MPIGKGAPGQPSAHWSWRLYAVAAILAVLVLSTIVAYRQEPFPNPYVEPTNWFLHPREHAAYRRLPSAGVNLNCLSVNPTTGEVWVAGENATILYSADSGETWKPVHVPTEDDPQPASDNATTGTTTTASLRVPVTNSLAFAVANLSMLADEPSKSAGNPKQASPVQAPPATPASKSEVAPQPPTSPVQNAPTVGTPPTANDSKSGTAATEDKSDATQTSETNPPYRRRDVNIIAINFRDARRLLTDQGQFAEKFNGENWEWVTPAALTGDGRFIHAQMDRSHAWAITPWHSIYRAFTQNQLLHIQHPLTQDKYFWTDAYGDWRISLDGKLVRLDPDHQDPATQAPRNEKIDVPNADKLVKIFGSGEKSCSVLDMLGVLHTSFDDGKTWQSVRLTEVFHNLCFINPQQGWAVGPRGVFCTTDGGATWELRLAGASQQAALVTDGGYLLAPHGGISKISLNGSTHRNVSLEVPKDRDAPQPEARDYLLQPVALHFINSETGWVIGNDSSAEQIVCSRTSDGGRSWQKYSVKELRNVDQIENAKLHFASDGNAAFLLLHLRRVEWRGPLEVPTPFLEAIALMTVDGGQTWTKCSGVDNAHAVWLLNEHTAILGGPNGVQRYSIDKVPLNGNSNPAAQALPPTPGIPLEFKAVATSPNATAGPPTTAGSITALFFLNDEKGWAAGEHVYRTIDGGVTWEEAQQKPDGPIWAIHFVDKDHGTAAGDHGAIYSTENGGVTWKQGQLKSQENLLAVRTESPTNARAVSQAGTLFATTDSGATWHEMAQYSRGLAPWYFAMLSVCVIGLVACGVVQGKPPESGESSIADVLVSDNPVATSAGDRLGFDRLAAGLARFLRNVNTQPPLTIAVTGAWGSGKSSLMRMLQSHLEEHEHHTVWFNAWHHQEEQSLLAALLENIRAQAIPTIASVSGLRFRLQLLWIRAGSNWWTWFSLIAVFGIFVSLGFLVNAEHRPSTEGLVNDFKGLTKSFQSFMDGTEANSDAVTSNPKDPAKKTVTAPAPTHWLAALLASSITLAGLLYRALTSFSAKPAALLASAASKSSIADFTAQTSFRYRFARQFAEVTAALEPHTLIIFIDDLDRCRPDNLLAVLEAVNFLVSSGDCYIVMGLDRERVVPCIGLHFKSVVEEMAVTHSENAEEAAKVARERRVQYAETYLEKLINIEVPIQSPTDDQSKSLIGAVEKAQQNAPETKQKWWSRIAAAASLTGVVINTLVHSVLAWLVFLAAVGFWIGYQWHVTSAPQATVASAATTSPVLPPQGSNTSDSAGDRTTGGIVQNPLTTLEEPKRAPQATTEAAKPPRDYTWPAIVGAGILGLCWLILTIENQVPLRDSQTFQQSLALWHPWLSRLRPTPRALKRFLNRVRFNAMYQTDEPPRYKSWAWLVAKVQELFGKVEGPTLREDRLYEDQLVATRVMQTFYPSWFNNRQVWAKLVEGEIPDSLPDVPNDQQESVKRDLQATMEQHQERFERSPFRDENLRALFPALHIAE